MTKQKTTKDNPLLNRAKEKTKHLQSLLKMQAPDISFKECSDIYAKFEGYPNWNRMKTALDKAYSAYQRGRDIVDLAVKVIENKEEAYRWMTSPQFGLGGKKPIEIWGTKQGRQQIKDMLMRIEYGVF